jgi:hypothetical protein
MTEDVPLRGRWCTLVSATEVLSCVLAAEHESSAWRWHSNGAQACGAPADPPYDDGERVVTYR